MAKANKLKMKAMPAHFEALMRAAGATATHADFRKGCDAFHEFCKTPLDCSHEILAFGANDTHQLSWWTGEHEFKIVLDRNIYGAGKESDKLFSARFNLVFPSSKASQKINLGVWDLEAGKDATFDAAKLQAFFERIDAAGELWAFLAKAQSAKVEIYAGEAG